MSGIKKIAESELKKAITAFYRQTCDITDPNTLAELYWLIVATHSEKVLQVLMGLPTWELQEARNMHYTFAKLPNTVCYIFEKILRNVFARNCCAGNKKLVKKGLEAWLNGEVIIDQWFRDHGLSK